MQYLIVAIYLRCINDNVKLQKFIEMSMLSNQ